LNEQIFKVVVYVRSELKKGLDGHEYTNSFHSESLERSTDGFFQKSFVKKTLEFGFKIYCATGTTLRVDVRQLQLKRSSKIALLCLIELIPLACPGGIYGNAPTMIENRERTAAFPGEPGVTGPSLFILHLNYHTMIG